MFPHYLTKGTIFGNNLLNRKCVFWFSLQLSSETFFILKKIQRDIIINVHRSSFKVPVIIVIFERKLNFPDFFKRYSNIKFQVNPSSGSGVFPWGRIDRYDEANSRFSQTCEGAYKRLGYRVYYEIMVLRSSVNTLRHKIHTYILCS